VAPRIIGAPLPKISAVEKAEGADLGAKRYTVSSNRTGPVNRHMSPRSVQGTLQADVRAGAGFGLAEVVVTPRRNKAARARKLKRIWMAEIGLDKEGGSPVLPAAGHARSVKMSDCCLQGIEPCKCKRKGHRWIGNQILDD
jgi:hypothetical protein